MENYTRVKLITDKYKQKGAEKGDTGAIIEILPPNKESNQYLLELFDFKTGITKTIIVVKEEDIEPLK
jgi:hypothetical protein